MVRAWAAGELGIQKLRDNIQDHHLRALNEGREDEWGFSTRSIPGLSAPQIVAKDDRIRQKRLRWTTVGRLREAGYEPVQDGHRHATVMLQGEPTDETYRELDGLFDQELINPFYEERNPV